MSNLARLSRVIVALAALLLATGCDRPDYESPIVNEGGPVIDIAQLPDIEQTTTEMIDLMERVSREVTRLVPAAEPWEWNRDQQGFSCKQESTGQDGVKRYLRSLTSQHALTEPEWQLVFPAVRQLASDAGLTEIAAPQDKPGNHDMRISSDDGRTLMFGSREATLITGDIACRRSAG
jgi:hypothetical protein